MKKFKVGLQLYSVRDHMGTDMEGTLKAVKEMGYDYVEFAGYYDKSAEEIKGLLDKYQLEAVSVHQAPTFFWEKGQEAIDFVKALGIRYAIIPWFDINDLTENWDENIKKFTELGELMKKNGIQFGYHNHDFELREFKNSKALDELLAAIPADVFVPEFDTCWLKFANCDPVDYINRYNDRVGILHLKDFVIEAPVTGAVYGLIDEKGKDDKPKKTKETSGFKFKALGQGCQNFKDILAAAEKANTEYVIVEQDNSYDDDSLSIAKESREYLKNTFAI